MATRHFVEKVEEPLKDVTADCFVYESNEVVSEESNDDGADKNETTMDGTHECDGGSSSASLSATIGGGKGGAMGLQPYLISRDSIGFLFFTIEIFSSLSVSPT